MKIFDICIMNTKIKAVQCLIMYEFNRQKTGTVPTCDPGILICDLTILLTRSQLINHY